jgi:hypothetical protein
MKKIYRILIALGVAVITLFSSIVLILFIFNVQAPRLAALLTIGAFWFTYKAIKPTQRELDKKKTLATATYHTNGLIKERGNIVYGKRQGDWAVFNEEGEYMETRYYDDGELKYTKENSTGT